MTPARLGVKRSNQALHHLWAGANTLLASAPTVAAHLAHTLATAAGEDGSRLARRMQCRHCDALLTLARVRVCTKVRRRRTHSSSSDDDAPRSGRCVVRSCPACGRADTVVVNTHAQAAQVRAASKAASKAARRRRVLPTETTSQGDVSQTAPQGSQSGKKKRRRKRKSSVSTPTTPLTPQTPQSSSTRTKKRAKKRPKVTPVAPVTQHRKGTPQTPGSGLQTASFLFEPLD